MSHFDHFKKNVIYLVKTNLCLGMASVSTPESMRHQVFEVRDLNSCCWLKLIPRSPAQKGLTLASLADQDFQEKDPRRPQKGKLLSSKVTACTGAAWARGFFTRWRSCRGGWTCSRARPWAEPGQNVQRHLTHWEPLLCPSLLSKHKLWACKQTSLALLVEISSWWVYSEETSPC